jgi:FADH2 O2-dependent halogenase
MTTATPSAPTRPDGYDHDVIILGAGIAGSMLGAILARHDTDVLLVDAGAHPKFAVGESMIPYTLLTLRTIAERYGVPEIQTLSTFDACVKRVNHSFGWKKHFGFLHHRPGEEPDWWEANQFNTPGILHKSSHLFRQDTDQYMFNTAVRYGARARLGYRVDDVDIDDDGVTVHGADGRSLRARYLVDASGFRSPLADKLGLREQPSRFKHHSRSIFTQMIGVKHTDDVLPHAPKERPEVPWHHGTMHHIFDRGWFWVIPFNNNPRSRNPLCSVGVTVDPRRYPKPDDMTPEQEFHAFAERFPTVSRQFADARPVREWVATPRLQYSSTQSVGARWCLMSHAAGFLDPLFSRGLSNTAEIINAFSWRLLAALREDDFSRERFEYVERLEQGLLNYNDALVNSAFISFDNYDLWNAVFRVWSYGSVVGGFRVQRALSRFKQDGDDRHLRELEEAPNVGLWWPDHQGYKELFDAMVTQTEAFEQGTVKASEAAGELFRRLQTADFIPHRQGFSDPETRFLRPTPAKLAGFVWWIAREAPPEMRELLVSNVRDVMKAGIKGRRLY